MNQRILIGTIAAVTFLSIGVIATARQQPVAVAALPEPLPTQTLITLRHVRIHIASNGTRTERELGFGEVGLSQNSTGSMHSQNSDIDYTAEPTMNADRTVNLHLKMVGARNPVAPSRSFIYTDAVLKTSALSSGQKLPLAAVANTNDSKVLDALAKRAPLPKIGKPYFVTMLSALTRTEPGKVYNEIGRR